MLDEVMRCSGGGNGQGVALQLPSYSDVGSSRGISDVAGKATILE